MKLRSGDTPRHVYAIENYRNTGRYLLVVEADLTPVPAQQKNGAWYDAPVLEFDAAYTWTDLEQFGPELVNYVAFESTTDNLRRDTLGTIGGQKGGPDTPAGGMNANTPSMPDDILAAMTDLDPETDENRFVYGKCSHKVSALTYALSGLQKTVRNDLVGTWTQGLEDQVQVTVYEGHRYTYQLRVSSAENTATKGIIIYDTLENYIIPDPTAEEDTDSTKAADYEHTQERKDWTGDWEGKGQWRGRLEAVDLSQFVDASVAPVLYYSEKYFQSAETKSESTDGDFEEDTDLLSSGYYDVTNQEVWTAATLDANGVWTVPDGVNVSAIAIDASKDVKGRDYVLPPDEGLSGFLHMRAPDDNGDDGCWNAKGAYARLTDDAGNYILDANGNQQVDWETAFDKENNMYAFNNARVRLIQGNAAGTTINWLSNYCMIRNDYTRVGILPSVINVTKEWQDQDNHDNMRPESVTVTVMRKLAGATGDPAPVLDAAGQPLKVELSAENEWTAKLLQMDVVNAEGVPYLYTFVEDPVPSYDCYSEYVAEDQYRLKNIHPNEVVEISGKKVWDDDNNEAGARPPDGHPEPVPRRREDRHEDGHDQWYGRLVVFLRRAGEVRGGRP